MVEAKLVDEAVGFWEGGDLFGGEEGRETLLPGVPEFDYRRAALEAAERSALK